MKHLLWFLALATVLIFDGCGTTIKMTEKSALNPLSFGLNLAKTGMERYKVLFETHQEAIRRGVGVSYAGIDSIEIELPSESTSIPLPNYTNFAGTTITVINNYKPTFLFSLTAKGNAVNITGKDIDAAIFTDVPELKRGSFLLSVKDKKPWVDNRIGYNYSHHRRDVFVVSNGAGSGYPIMPYGNANSSPECFYVPLSGQQIVIKGLRIIRSDKSTQITKVFKISMQSDVLISDIRIETNNPLGLYPDGAITITDSANITLNNIYARESYSRKDKYGYIFEFNNVSDVAVRNVDAVADWGVFGNNNVRNVHLENSHLNRFDIHCYGRNVSCKNCQFEGLYNQFSSTYGTVLFEGCTFSDFIPYLNAGSYNAFVPVDIEFKDCTFYLDKKHTSIVVLSGLSADLNSRPELKEKCLPNITMTDCIVNLEKGMSDWYIIHPGTVSYEKPFGHISKVMIKRITSNAPEKAMSIFKEKVKTSHPIRVTAGNIKYVGNE